MRALRHPHAALLAAFVAACTPTRASSGPSATPSAPSAATAPSVASATAEPSAPVEASPASLPALRIDASLKARLRETLRSGASRGLRADVFMKVGDSISAAPTFLTRLAPAEGGAGAAVPDELEAARGFFSRARVDTEGHTPFDRPSLAARPGWRVADVLALDDEQRNPLGREFAALRPAFAFVLLGTNDLVRGTDDELVAGLERLVADLLRRGVIPVLHTLPPRTDAPGLEPRVRAVNARIAALAQTQGAPLLDLFAALWPLPNHGLDADGVHPSAGDGGFDFTDRGLRFGANRHNLLALRALHTLRTVVIGDGPPDAPDAPAGATP